MLEIIAAHCKLAVGMASSLAGRKGEIQEPFPSAEQTGHAMISSQAAAHMVGVHWQEKCDGHVITPTFIPPQLSQDEEHRCATGSRTEIPHETGGR